MANVRIHGTTRERPVDRFEKEKSGLKPGPLLSFDADTVATLPASKDYRITFDANTYTVPPLYAGLLLTVKANDHEVRIFKANRLIASHIRCWQKHRPIEDPKHTEEVLEEKKRAAQAKAKDLFLSLGEAAEEYLKGLIQTPRAISQELKKINALPNGYAAYLVLEPIYKDIHIRIPHGQPADKSAEKSEEQG